jgi:effector-binding domain-containing protein
VKRQLAQLDQLFTHLSEAPMTDITTRTIPARTILALRKVVPDRRGQMQLWDTLAHLSSEVDLPQRPTTGGVTYFDDGYRDHDIDIAVWVSIPESTPVPAPLVCQEVEEHTVVVATHRGPYTTITDAMTAVARYLAAQDIRKTGLISHVYVVGREQTNDPSEYVTEIHVPV